MSANISAFKIFIIEKNVHHKRCQPYIYYSIGRSVTDNFGHGRNLYKTNRNQVGIESCYKPDTKPVLITLSFGKTC